MELFGVAITREMVLHGIGLVFILSLVLAAVGRVRRRQRNEYLAFDEGRAEREAAGSSTLTFANPYDWAKVDESDDDVALR